MHTLGVGTPKLAVPIGLGALHNETANARYYWCCCMKEVLP